MSSTARVAITLAMSAAALGPEAATARDDCACR